MWCGKLDVSLDSRIPKLLMGEGEGEVPDLASLIGAGAYVGGNAGERSSASEDGW